MVQNCVLIYYYYIYETLFWFILKINFIFNSFEFKMVGSCDVHHLDHIFIPHNKKEHRQIHAGVP